MVSLQRDLTIYVGINANIRNNLQYENQKQKNCSQSSIFPSRHLASLAHKFGASYYEIRQCKNTPVNHCIISMITGGGKPFISKSIPINNIEMYDIKPYDKEGTPCYDDGKPYFDKTQFNNDIIAIMVIGNKATIAITNFVKKESEEFELEEGNIAFLKECGKYSWSIKPSDAGFRALIIFRFGCNSKFIVPT